MCINRNKKPTLFPKTYEFNRAGSMVLLQRGKDLGFWLVFFFSLHGDMSQFNMANLYV